MTRPSRAVRRPTLPKETSPDVQQAIATEYQAGMQMNELARKYKVHRVTVRTCLDRMGIEIRQKGLAAEQIDQAQRLYEREQLSLAVIAERLGTTARTVHSRLRQRGVVMRDTHGRPSPS